MKADFFIVVGEEGGKEMVQSPEVKEAMEGVQQGRQGNAKRDEKEKTAAGSHQIGHASAFGLETS